MSDGDVRDLPGVGGDDVPLRSVLGEGPVCARLVTVGAMWALGFAIFSTTALLASDIACHYDFSLRWLVLVVVLPGFTIALVSQPLGNFADRPTTNRPRVENRCSTNAIGGFVPSSGRIEVPGRDLSELPPYRRARLGLGRGFQAVRLLTTT